MFNCDISYRLTEKKLFERSVKSKMAAISFDVTDPIMSPDLINIHKYCIRVTFAINAITYPSGSTLFHFTFDRTF